MPTLPNSKHEAFAYAVSKGVGIAEAYVQAGYNDSPPSATRLAKKPEVAARIEEIRGEMLSRAKAIVQAPTEENAVALAEMGLTLDWCMQQFKEIADEARAAGQFAPANAAIKNIQGIIEIKSSKDEGGKPDEDQKYSLKEIGNIADMLSALPEQPIIKDVTPAPPMEPVAIPTIPDVGDA